MQLCLKWNHTTREFPQDDTKTVDVALGRICNRGILHPFGSDIGYDAKETRLGGIDGFVDRLAESKVGDQGLSASVNEDVTRVKVGMKDVFAVNKVKSTGNLPGKAIFGKPGDGNILGLEIIL